MADSHDGPVTIVTGGASGMGEATVRLLCARGHAVYLADIQRERGDDIVSQLDGLAKFVPTDMTHEDEVRALVETAMDEYGRVTGFVNNAGIIGAVGPIDQITIEEWDFSVTMLLRSTFLGVKHAARVMKPANRGSIVNAASISAFRGGIGPHPYSAAKAGVVSLTRNAAAELGAFGIRVNSVAPGRIATPMVADTWAGDHTDINAAARAIASESPLLDRVGNAEDIAEAYAWLLSDAAGYVTGQVIAVDGGVIGGVPPVAEARERLARYQGVSSVVREGGKRGLPS